MFLKLLILTVVMFAAPTSPWPARSWDNPIQAFLNGMVTSNGTIPPAKTMNKRVPPINMLKDLRVPITVQLYIFSVPEITEAQGRFVFSGMLLLSWSVGPVGFYVPNNVYEVTLTDPLESAWYPKVVIRNQINFEDWKPSIERSPLDIYAPDRVYWRLYNNYELTCNFSLRNYPFDVSKCRVSLFPVTDFLNAYFNMTAHHPLCLKFFSPNPQWNVLGSRNFLIDYGFGVGEMNIEIVISRKSEFSIMSFLMPIMLLALTGTCICLVPPDSEEKMGISVTIVLSFFVIFGSMTTSFPTTSDFDQLPLVYWLLFVFFCLTLLSTVYAAILLRLSDYVEKAKSPNLFGWIEKILHKHGKKNKTDPSLDVAHASKLELEWEHDEKKRKLARGFLHYANRIGVWVYLFYVAVTTITIAIMFKQNIDVYTITPHPNSDQLFIMENLTFYKPQTTLSECLYCVIDKNETKVNCAY